MFAIERQCYPSDGKGGAITHDSEGNHLYGWRIMSGRYETKKEAEHARGYYHSGPIDETTRVIEVN